jgi:hypothetical protein
MAVRFRRLLLTRQGKAGMGVCWAPTWRTAAKMRAGEGAGRPGSCRAARCSKGTRGACCLPRPHLPADVAASHAGAAGCAAGSASWCAAAPAPAWRARGGGVLHVGGGVEQGRAPRGRSGPGRLLLGAPRCGAPAARPGAAAIGGPGGGAGRGAVQEATDKGAWDGGAGAARARGAAQRGGARGGSGKGGREGGRYTEKPRPGRANRPPSSSAGAATQPGRRAPGGPKGAGRPGRLAGLRSRRPAGSCGACPRGRPWGRSSGSRPRASRRSWSCRSG